MSTPSSASRPVQAHRLTEVSPAERRRALTRALISMVVTFFAVIALYYVVPLSTRELGVRSLVRLGVGLALFVGILVWLVRGILRSDLPELRAAQAVVVAVPVFLTGYAVLYYVLSREGGGFTEPLTRTSALYFAVVVFGSVGFGDITPTSDLNRIVVMSQVLAGLAFIAVAIRIFFAASRLRLNRDRPASDGGQRGE
ncbi:MAG: potassium channel family protein [Propionibacteriaceae bacterium]